MEPIHTYITYNIIKTTQDIIYIKEKTKIKKKPVYILLVLIKH